MGEPVVVLRVGSPLLPGRASASVKSSLSHQRVCYLRSVLAPAAPPTKSLVFPGDPGRSFM